MHIFYLLFLGQFLFVHSITNFLANPEPKLHRVDEKKHTMMEQINHYRQNTLWEILSRYLPNLEIKNVNDMYKMVKTMENLRKFEDVQMKHKFWS